MTSFEAATEKAIAFRNARDWKQFHTPKDLAVSLAIEVAELLEVFQWSGSDSVVSEKRDRAIDELADVAIYCAYLADALGINLGEEMVKKIELNESRYPLDKAAGNAKKYTEL